MGAAVDRGRPLLSSSLVSVRHTVVPLQFWGLVKSLIQVLGDMFFISVFFRGDFTALIFLLGKYFAIEPFIHHWSFENLWEIPSDITNKYLWSLLMSCRMHKCNRVLLFITEMTHGGSVREPREPKMIYSSASLLWPGWVTGFHGLFLAERKHVLCSTFWLWPPGLQFSLRTSVFRGGRSARQSLT